MNKYHEWIENYLLKHNHYVTGKCAEATKEMKSEFDELIRVRGHVFTDIGRRQHWWLVTEDDEIIDRV